jgi:hypothetical protein
MRSRPMLGRRVRIPVHLDQNEARRVGRILNYIEAREVYGYYYYFRLWS